jgi:hypothetical protein
LPVPAGLVQDECSWKILIFYSRYDSRYHASYGFITLITQSSLIKKIWRKKARSCGLQSYGCCVCDL